MDRINKLNSKKIIQKDLENPLSEGDIEKYMLKH